MSHAHPEAGYQPAEVPLPMHQQVYQIRQENAELRAMVRDLGQAVAAIRDVVARELNV